LRRAHSTQGAPIGNTVAEIFFCDAVDIKKPTKRHTTNIPVGEQSLEVDRSTRRRTWTNIVRHDDGPEITSIEFTAWSVNAAPPNGQANDALT